MMPETGSVLIKTRQSETKPARRCNFNLRCDFNFNLRRSDPVFNLGHFCFDERGAKMLVMTVQNMTLLA